MLAGWCSLLIEYYSTYIFCINPTTTTPPPPPLCWFFLNNLEAVKPYSYNPCISLETSVPNLVSLTRPSLQVLGKTQTAVFPIPGFLLNPL